MNRRLFEFVTTEEYAELLQAVHETAKEFPDIIGVLAVGSIVQPPVTPDDFYVQIYNSEQGRAYEKIRNPNRRRLAVHKGSDLDIWVCTKDTPSSRNAQNKVEDIGVRMISELSSGILEWGTVRWHNEKLAAMGQYYKNHAFYSQRFIESNNGIEPWMAYKFTALLETNIIRRMPKFVSNVNQYFHKKIPGKFIEVRAFPESLFHLRPDDTRMPNMQEDRMAFPRIANQQWIGPDSSLVLYASNNVSIYPFRENGRVLGERIASYLATSKKTVSGRGYGGLVIKPDAIRKGQTDIIMNKIKAEVKKLGGNIIVEKSVKPILGKDVEIMYPYLKEDDLRDTKNYLEGQEMIVIIIKSDDLPTSEMFKRMNALKGPRLIDRSYERLVEGRTINGSLRDLLPIPGEEEQYLALLPTILAKKANASVRFSENDFRYYVQNLVHSPDNEDELAALFKLADFYPT